MSIEQQLSGLAQSLRIELLEDPKPETLEPVRASIGPELPNLEVTEILEGVVDLNTTIQPLTAVKKDVRFSDQFPEVPSGDQESFNDLDKVANVVGGMPIPTLSNSGVPGLIAQLSGLVAGIKGKIPIPSTTSVPVTMEASWFVSDKEDGTTELKLGEDYLAPDGLLSGCVFRLPPKVQGANPGPRAGLQPLALRQGQASRQRCFDPGDQAPRRGDQGALSPAHDVARGAVQDEGSRGSFAAGDASSG